MKDLNPTDLLRAENAELRRLVHLMQDRLQSAIVEHTLLTHMMASVVVQSCGTLDIPFEWVQAAHDFCGFRIHVEQIPRADKQIDARVTAVPLTVEEREAMNAPPVQVELPTQPGQHLKLILPE